MKLLKIINRKLKKNQLELTKEILCKLICKQKILKFTKLIIY